MDRRLDAAQSRPPRRLSVDRRKVGDTPQWCDRWELAWGDVAAGLGGVVELALCTGSGRASFTSLLVRREGLPVAVVSSDLTPPAGSSSLEVRGDGLWADLVVEEPLVHLSCNLEAFGVQVDALVDVSADARGVLVPFGYELDFLTDGRGDDPTELDCRVEGIVLLGADTIDVEGAGRRRHCWGEGPGSAPAGVAHLVDVLRDVLAGGLDVL